MLSCYSILQLIHFITDQCFSTRVPWNLKVLPIESRNANLNNVCNHQMHFLGSYCIQNAFVVAALPRTPLWELTALLQTSVIYVNYNYNENREITRKKWAVNDNYN